MSVLFIGMLFVLELGRRLGNRRLSTDPEGARAGTGTVEGAVFALLGLVIAFTFSGAASRFDTRHDLIVQEPNAIGTVGGRSRNWLHIVSFPAVMAIAVYVILDIEYPRLGLIQGDAFEPALVELRESMK
jgi:hypothetical protein